MCKLSHKSPISILCVSKFYEQKRNKIIFFNLWIFSLYSFSTLTKWYQSLWVWDMAKLFSFVLQRITKSLCLVIWRRCLNLNMLRTLWRMLILNQTMRLLYLQTRRRQWQNWRKWTNRPYPLSIKSWIIWCLRKWSMYLSRERSMGDLKKSLQGAEKVKKVFIPAKFMESD